MIPSYKSIEFDITPGTGKLIPRGILSQHDKDNLTTGNIIYIYKGDRDVYVGQTQSFYQRHSRHCAERSNGSAKGCKYTDGSYTRVIAALSGSLITASSLNDIERQYITYMTADADGTNITVNNDTAGNTSIPYVNQEQVLSDFILPFWKELYEKGYVQNADLDIVKNSILFKYSPFFCLSDEQQRVLNDILANPGNSLVYGLAGTGKTVLITNLAVRYAKLHPNARIAVACQSNWTDSGQKIFRSYGADNITVDTALKLYRSGIHYDYILVDEAHRLRRYYSKTNHVRDDIFEVSMDPVTGQKTAGANELQQLLRISDQLVLFYDPLQSIKPTDIRPADFTAAVEAGHFRDFHLQKEYRVAISDKDKRFTGDDFVNGILSVLQISQRPFHRELFSDYLIHGQDAYFGIVNSIEGLFDDLGLMELYLPTTTNRVLAGYTKKWVSKKDKSLYDWIEGENHWHWNSTNKNWINRPGSRDEIGCIHSIQGVDLNYVGVIISKDLMIRNGRLYGEIANYRDENGKFSKADFDQKAFDDYIKNIYYVLLTRGISGIRVYFEDKDVEKYFKDYFKIQ